jgi:Tfp pilus assembly protein PilF
MPRREPINCAVMSMILALGLLGGCSTAAFRPKEKASRSLLDTGPSDKVTSRQSADIQVALGRTMEEEGKPEEARPAYLAALKKDPNRADAELRLAIIDDRNGDHKAADKHFARALKLQPKNPEILCDQGYSLYLRRSWADAETSLKQALAIDKAHTRSHMNLALVLARQGDDKGALAEFARAGCDPSDARANLGLVLGLEGRFEEARREYALALVAKPGSSQAKEGLKASSVALLGKADDRAIAGKGPPGLSRLDPALQRTSAPPSREPDR